MATCFRSKAIPPKTARNQFRSIHFSFEWNLQPSRTCRFFKDARNKELLKSLTKAGLTLKETATATGPRPLADQTYVVTGTLPTLSRQQARDLIEAAGGHVSDSLSKKTTALVVGADPGSKLDKAKALGVEPIDEAELLRRANRKP